MFHDPTQECDDHTGASDASAGNHNMSEPQSALLSRANHEDWFMQQGQHWEYAMVVEVG